MNNEVSEQKIISVLTRRSMCKSNLDSLLMIFAAGPDASIYLGSSRVTIH